MIRGDHVGILQRTETSQGKTGPAWIGNLMKFYFNRG